ncbi:hypothetical protein G4D82_06280 [Flavobacterium sp. CYK-4]|uniref:hypothetical protein n=1 Tax=Flavobacterium lotistagni TaxID=2709660 RepID=UPI00140895A1|nr:hypothetical protein [Flavobacterium lotistagni]NHM06820.1 hypothetical protein [Flavobacterium lotistagni]
MKKLFFTSLMAIGFALTTQAQKISDNALGLRLGDNDGFGAEVSYQRALGDANRLEADLGWRNSKRVSAIKLTGLYQWVWNIDGGFNWYAGAGGGLGSWRYDDRYDNDLDDSGSFAFIAGDIGIEYDFDIPLMISLDFRPEFGGKGYYKNNYGSDIALGVRYQF